MKKKNAIRLNTGLWFGHPIAVDTGAAWGRDGTFRGCM